MSKRVVDVLIKFAKLQKLAKKNDEQHAIHVEDDYDSSLTKQEDSFVRDSTKYWVQSCDLAAVCTVLSENLEVHSFADNNPWTYISSVYLDNMSRDCYKSRIVKDAGARLVRLRTYDNNINQIFVERKIHHEKWTGESSSKDRFPIDENDVMPFLRGQSFKVAEKYEPLRQELQNMILDSKLFPTLRVNYTRIAFQPKRHDHVRVSIDINLEFIHEKTTHMDWRSPEDKLVANDQIFFPYSIVEIKLREPYISNPPLWLKDLEQSSLLKKENSFSKYVHGTYAFSLNDNNILNLREPIWFNSVHFVSPQMPIYSQSGKSEKQIKHSNDNRHWFYKLIG